MRIDIQQHAAMNLLSVRPVLVIGSMIDAPPNLAVRFAKLGKTLPSVSGSDAVALGTDNLALSVARLAAHLQEMLGIADMQIIDTHDHLPSDRVAFECLFLETGRDLVSTVGALLLIDPDASDYEAQVQKSVSGLSRAWQPALTHFATQTARRLGIPWQVETRQITPLLSLGQGVHRRLFWRHMTPETPEIGVVFSTPKNISGELLQNAGLPVPRSGLARNLQEAKRIASSLGWPVVTKPARTDHGTGITTGIDDDATLAKAFEVAHAYGDVLVQSHIYGDQYRLLVHDGLCISAIRLTPAQVVGDGTLTIRELIEKTNIGRTDVISPSWKKIQIDPGLQQTLATDGLSLDDVPEQGKAVRLRTQANISQGGTMENVKHDVHPDNRRFAERAASVFGLDLAGIDILSTDIRKPLFENGGAIVEVNATPMLMMAEEGYVIEDQIISRFLPAPQRGRVPVVVCVSETDDLAHVLADALGETGVSVAVASPGGVRVGDHQMSLATNQTAPQRTRTVLSHHRTELAVLSVTPEELLTKGLGVDRISVAIGPSQANKAAVDALICLGRGAAATIAFEADVARVCAERSDSNLVWCVQAKTDDPKSYDLKRVSTSGSGQPEHHPFDAAEIDKSSRADDADGMGRILKAVQDLLTKGAFPT